MLKIIGTSHISKQSVNDIKEQFNTYEPDILCLELDMPRFNALMSTKKEERTLKDYIEEIKHLGIKGFLFSLIGAYIEKKLGSSVGTEPGVDMKTAANLAIKSKLPIFLIDQDIKITLRKFSKIITFREKFNFFMDIIKSLFGFNQFKEMKIKIDLNKVPGSKDIEKILKFVKKRYPNFYLVLIEERNQIMARNIANLIKNYPEKKILAVVGAGHENEIAKLTKKYLNSAS